MAKTLTTRVQNLESRAGGADPEPLVIQYVADWPHGHEPAPDHPGLDAIVMGGRENVRKVGPCTYEVRPGGVR